MLMQMKKPILQFSLVKLFESLRQVVKPISNRPPSIRKIQAIVIYDFWINELRLLVWC